MHTKVFAVSGNKYSGKSTLEEIFVRQAKAMGLTVAVIRCADETKAQYVKKHGLAGDYFSSRARKEGARESLSAFAMDRFLHDREAFLKPLVDAAQRRDVALVLVPDVRLKCQLATLEKSTPLGRVVKVRVTASDGTRFDRGWTPSPDDFSLFEADLDDYADWDEVITNDGTVAELDAAVADLLARWV